MDHGNAPSEESPLMTNGSSTGNDRPGIPQLFTSVPSLNDAASYLAETTSIFTRCFTNVSVGPVSENSDGREVLTFASGEAISLTPNQNMSLSGSVSSVFESVDTKFDAPVVHGGITRSSAGEPSQSSSLLVQSNNPQNGISLFQGLVEKVKRTVQGSAVDIGWLQRDPNMPPVEDGTEKFTEILDNIRHGLHGLPNTMVYLLVPGLFSNHGPLYFVNTKTSFSKMGLTCHIAKIHSEASVEKNAKEIKDYIEELYWGSNKRVLLLGHSKGGVDAAASLSMYWDELKDKVAGLALAQSPYGGSPIASDILREGQLGDYFNVRKLMDRDGAKGGARVATAPPQFFNFIEYEFENNYIFLFFLLIFPLAPPKIFLKIFCPPKLYFLAPSLLMEILICKVIKGDIQALEDLTYERRKNFLREYHLPRELPVVSFHTEASISPAVLATLSRVAHAELPMFSPLASGSSTTLPVVIPLGAAMAACAQLLLTRYGEKSDGLVTCCDAEVPGSIVVRPKRKLDHAWMVYSSLDDDPSEANASQVCEALLTLLVEAGHKKRQELANKDE